MIKSLKSVNVSKNTNIYKNASIVACVAGGVSTTLAYCNLIVIIKKKKGKKSP